MDKKWIALDVYYLDHGVQISLMVISFDMEEFYSVSNNSNSAAFDAQKGIVFY